VFEPRTTLDRRSSEFGCPFARFTTG
jgi:hypothetical protein